MLRVHCKLGYPTLLILLLLTGCHQHGAESLPTELPRAEEIEFRIAAEVFNLERDRERVKSYYLNRPSDPATAFSSHEAVTLDQDLAWSEDPFGSRNWRRSLHQLVILSCLVAAYDASADDWYLLRLQEQVIDWATDNLLPAPPSDLTWHDQATADRAWNIALSFEYLRVHRPDLISEVFFDTAIRLLFSHANLLAEDFFFARHSNHGWDQARILLNLALHLPEFVAAGDWRRVATSRAIDEVEFAFTPEGVHVENSTGYHLRMLDSIVQFQRHLQSAGATSILPEVGDLIDRGARFAAHVLHPSGRIPLIGDSEDRRARFSFCNDRASLECSEYLYAQSRGRAGTAPLEVDGVFPRSGYAILRDRWHDASSYGDTVQLVLKADGAPGWDPDSRES